MRVANERLAELGAAGVVPTAARRIHICIGQPELPKTVHLSSADLWRAGVHYRRRCHRTLTQILTRVNRRRISALAEQVYIRPNLAAGDVEVIHDAEILHANA